MLLRGFRLFGVALHREPKGTKRDDSPLEVHCSGLGGGLLSPERTYDIFLQNHAQIKVYGPSLAMTDNWDG